MMAQDDPSSGPAHPLIESDHIEGTAVYDVNGKPIGSIKRLVIEKVSGRVVYAVTSFGGFLGLGVEAHTILGINCTTTPNAVDIGPASPKHSCATHPSFPVETRLSYLAASRKN
jgi:PRC-barrel domain